MTRNHVGAVFADIHVAMALEFQIFHDGTAAWQVAVRLSPHPEGQETIVDFLLRVAECSEVIK
jgi:hypothetical protein